MSVLPKVPVEVPPGTFQHIPKIAAFRGYLGLDLHKV